MAGDIARRVKTFIEFFILSFYKYGLLGETSREVHKY